MGSPQLIGFEHKLVVGVGDMAVSNNPNLVLTTYSLGSCLGISIYDPVVRVAGLLHIMLPDSSIDPAKAAARPCMFVDTGTPLLFRSAYELGAVRQRLKITVAGGAQIMDGSGFFNIGKRNVDAFSELLARNSLSVLASQVGGMVNRTMNLHIATGAVRLKISGQPEEVSLWTP
jgi:chemotaxis protein CheD